MEKEPDDINCGQLHNEKIVTLNTQHLTSLLLQFYRLLSGRPPTQKGKHQYHFILLSRNFPCLNVAPYQVGRDDTIYVKQAYNWLTHCDRWQKCSYYQARCSWIVTDSCKAGNWVVMNSRGTSNQSVTNVCASVLLTSLQWLFFCSESEYHIKQVIF